MGDSLIIKIGANAKNFNDELKRLQAKTKDLEKGLATTAKISAAGFTALAGAVGVAVNKFANFEKGFSSVQTLLDKSSFSTKTFAKGIQDLQNDVLKLGAASGESFDTLNQALFDLISAGVPAEEATSALADAVDLAAAGATETAISVKALTAAYTAYGKEAGTSAEVAEKFFTAQKFGVTTVEDLATGFNKVAGTAKQLGIGFNEILAASTALTANGAKPTAQAFTEVKAVLNSVILAQSKLKDESLEVQNALSLQNIEQKGLVTALQELKVATNGDVVAIQKLLGSAEALSGVFSLTGQQAALYSKIIGELNDEQARAAAFNDALVVKQETVDKSLKKLNRSLEAVAITFGERFAPLISDAAAALTGLAQGFSELDDETKDSIVTFIKWGAAITAGVATLSTAALLFIKFTALVSAIGTALSVAAPVAAAFWVALTGPIGLAVAGIAAVGTGIAVLVSKLSKKEEPKTLTEINNQLDSLKKKQDAVNNASGLQGYERQSQLDGINEEISKLEELRKKQLAAENQTSDGSILLRPKTDGSDPLAGITEQLTGAKPVEIPLRPVVAEEAKAEGGGAEATKKTEEAKTAAVNTETAKRIQAAQNEQEILKAKNQELSNEEIEFLQRRQDLKAEAADAENIKNEEERALALENLQLKNEALLLEEQEFFLRKQEEKALQREQELELQEEINALDQEQRDLLNEKELEDLRNQILTKQEAKKQNAKQELQDNIKRRNQFIKDEQKHGLVVATLNKTLNSQEVQGVRNTSGQLAQLQNSKNKTLKEIGKKAALANIAIDTAKGAIGAYSSLSSIPFVGPALGVAAAAALTAYGAERVSAVNSAQRGGIVPNVGGGARDRVPMLLEPNELVVPKGLAPDFIQSVGRPDAQADDGEENSNGSMVEIAIEDDATDFITAKQRENNNLAIGVA